MKITPSALAGARPWRVLGSRAMVRYEAAAAAFSGRITARTLARRRDHADTSVWDEAVTMPAHPSSIREARRWLAALLAGHPAVDDAVLCLSELATNASVHSQSRQTGGTYSVRAAADPATVRVEVTDQGGPWRGPGGDPARGRGLAVVASLASSWGVSGGPAGRTVWCEFTALDTKPGSDHGTPCAKEPADAEPGG